VFEALIGCTEETFISGGCSHWKNATGSTGKLYQHSTTDVRTFSTQRFHMFRKSTPVDAQLDDQRAAHLSLLEEQRLENRRIVESLFDCIQFLGMLGLACRGRESNSGNFVATMQFLPKYHPPLQHYLEKHPGNVSYMSVEKQNEMIDVTAKQIMQTVTGRDKSAKWF
jgi:hypothetical protein